MVLVRVHVPSWHPTLTEDHQPSSPQAPAPAAQKSITNLVCELFGISSGYVGTIKSNMAKLVMNQVVSDINEKHMAPWSVMCSEVNLDAWTKHPNSCPNGIRV